MKIPENFRDIGRFDVSKIKAHIAPFQHEWDLDKSRQERYRLFHGDSRNIFITDIDASWNGFGYPLVKYNIHPFLNELTSPIVKALEDQFDGKAGKCLFINLPAGKKVHAHVDRGYYLTSVRRCHIPIQTNENVWFTVGDETINMKEGTGYEINNTRLHAVTNNSDSDRIHLLIDIIQPHIFKSTDPSMPQNVSSAILD